MFADDQVSGVSVCCRDRDDILQVWNVRADREKQSTILEKIQSLVPSVKFTAAFYKRKLLLITFIWSYFLLSSRLTALACDST